jgi:hypothetical protein
MRYEIGTRPPWFPRQHLRNSSKKMPMRIQNAQGRH